MDLNELNLTRFQMKEVLAAEPELVEAWLQAAGAPQINSPAGYLLQGIRSGEMPIARNDNKRREAVRLAEAWIVNAGLYFLSEEELLDELFGRRGGLLHPWYDDDDLREQMLDVYRHERMRVK